MIEPNTFICGDCKDVLEQLPDGFADLCLTDPPYGIGQDGGVFRDRKGRGFHRVLENKGWDNQPPNPVVFHHLKRTSINQIIWGGNYFTDCLPVSRCWLYWDKLMGGDFSDGELAWTSFDSVLKKFTYCNKGGGKEHPTQKPVALFVWCLQKYSKPGDLIIDPFCGSGTTALACHKTGRRFICIDKDPDYIKIAKRRYEELIAQGDLFGSAPEQRQPQNSVQHSYEAINLK